MSQEIYTKLKAYFSPEDIHWRIGATNKDKTKGIALAYIDARDVMERLDGVVGYENWQSKSRKDGDTYFCELLLRINGEWISKTGGAGATQVEEQKGGDSAAFKRAAAAFGIGRYLYDIKNCWVDLDGKAIKQSEYAKLRGLLPGPKSADFEKLKSSLLEADSLKTLGEVWAKSAARIASMPAIEKNELTSIKDNKKLAYMEAASVI